MARIMEGKLKGDGRKVTIIVSRFNDFITGRLVEGAEDALTRHGVSADDITLIRVPGAWEIPAMAARVARAAGTDAVICLGAVIRGATPHFDMVAAESAKGISHVGMDASMPVIYGVLTTDTIEQAVERAGTKAGNKGFDAAMAALEMMDLYTQIG